MPKQLELLSYIGLLGYITKHWQYFKWQVHQSFAVLKFQFRNIKMSTAKLGPLSWPIVNNMCISFGDYHIVVRNFVSYRGGGGGHSNGKKGYQARPWTHKEHPNHIFFMYENKPKYAFLHAFFLICLSCPFQNLSIWPKTHPFFKFCTFLHP